VGVDHGGRPSGRRSGTRANLGNEVEARGEIPLVDLAFLRFHGVSSLCAMPAFAESDEV
jgi:hypothetical protein